MKKLKFNNCFIFSAIGLFFCVSAAAGQYKNAGQLNVWTTGVVQRKHDDEATSTSLCKVRVAKNKDYDRVVFEFDGGKPDYIIQYLPSNIYTSEAGDEKIKIAGNRFLVIYLYGMGIFEEMPCELESFPEGELDLPTVKQIEDKGRFEGIRDLLVGVKAKKTFRVQELLNPSRLVIDFTH